MPGKLSIPSTSALNDGTLSVGTTLFLQSVENGLKTIDGNVVYKDAVSAAPTPITLRAISANGVVYPISGTSVASGDDYIALVNDVKTLLNSYNQLQQTVTNLIKEVRGK